MLTLLLSTFIFFQLATFFNIGENITVILRRALLPGIPFSLIAGFGLSSVYGSVTSLRRRVSESVYYVLVLLVLLSQLSYSPVIREPERPIIDSVNRAMEFGRTSLPEDCSVVSDLPWAVIVGMRRASYDIHPKSASLDDIVDRTRCTMLLNTTALHTDYSEHSYRAREFERLFADAKSRFDIRLDSSYAHPVGDKVYEFRFYSVKKKFESV